MKHPKDVLDIQLALNRANITSATTTTGNTLDTRSEREYLLMITFDTFTVNLLTALNLQIFHGSKSDLADEAQFGSSLDLFTSIAANSVIYVRLQAEQYKQFFRAKLVSTGAPTALGVTMHVIGLEKPMVGALITPVGTI